MEQEKYNTIRDRLRQALANVWSSNRPSITLRGSKCVLDARCPTFHIEDEEQLVNDLATYQILGNEKPTIMGWCEVWTLFGTQGDRESVRCTFEIYGSDYSSEYTGKQISMTINRFSRFVKR